jgi:hypothetical protein
MKRIHLLRILLLFGFITFSPVGVLQSAKAGQGIEKPLLSLKSVEYPKSSPDFQKVSSILRTMIEKVRTGAITKQYARGQGDVVLSDSLVRVNEVGNIQTYIHVDSIGSEESALIEAYDVKVEITNEKLGIIQAWIPYNKIDEVAQFPFVKRITPPSYGTPRVGSKTTEGDSILRADELRALGFDGSGVKVGVISDGIDNIAAAQGTNDLPASVTTQTFAGSGDEGTAMLEIVYDLAPGAELGFCGPATSLEMIQCVNDLADPTKFGADIVVDDLGFILEPYFEDGPVAQAVAGVLSTVIYASSAGNSAQTHYQGDFLGTNVLGFQDSGPPVRPLPEHNFGNAAGGASDPTMDILLLPGITTIILQWNDAFGEAGNDYDLLILNEAEDTVLFASADTQDGDDDPIENLGLINIGAVPVRVKIAVAKFSGEERFLKLFLFSSVLVEEYSVPEGSIFGHPAVPGVLAVAAINANDPGNDTIEGFSSRGPVEIFFPSPETRLKPDVTAVDGVSVTGAGGFPSPFFGTSAAAPHVAGVAALLQGGFTTPLEIIDALKSSAVDLGNPGADNTFGAGRIDAFAAAQQLNLPPSGTIDIPAGDKTIVRGQSVDFSSTCTDPNSIVNATFLWDFGAGSGIANATQEDPGNVVFNNSGTFTVSFTCTDGFGESDPIPDTLNITVNEPSSESSGGGSGGGGGCFIDTAADN